MVDSYAVFHSVVEQAPRVGTWVAPDPGWTRRMRYDTRIPASRRDVTAPERRRFPFLSRYEFYGFADDSRSRLSESQPIAIKTGMKEEDLSTEFLCFMVSIGRYDPSVWITGVPSD